MSRDKKPHAVSNDAAKRYSKAVLDADKLWKNVFGGVSNPVPMIFKDGLPLLFKNSIIVIQGKSGVHKSRISSNLCSALIASDQRKEFLGFTRNHEETFIVLYVDTERNITSQLPEALRQMLRDAGHIDNRQPFTLVALPLVNVMRAYRFEVFSTFLQELEKTKQTREHIVVVIDVITDFTTDFNQIGETFALIDLMNVTVNESDISFIAIIHENPGSEKARGHVGTEITNKASSVLQISEAQGDGVYCIKVSKSRNTKKFDPFYVKFDPTVNNLVLIDDGSEQVRAKDPYTAKLVKVLGDNLGVEMDRPKLVGILVQKLQLKERAIESKLKQIIANKVLIETVFGRGTLEKVSGRPVKYRIQYLTDVVSRSA